MKEQFKNSPLVELIAEVRWNAGTNTEGFVMPGDSLQQHEDFFKRLTHEVANIGYTTSERLLPQGFPFPGQAPVMRFKKSVVDAESDNKARQLSTLLQVGSGLFTINAIQPYSCWDDFIGVIRDGLNALFKAEPYNRPAGYNVSVRYVDAFGKHFSSDLNLRSFMSKALGISVNFPAAFTNGPVSGDTKIQMMQTHTPLSFGFYNMTFAEAQVQNQPVLVMESHVVVHKEIEQDAEKLIYEMTNARNVVHRRFVELTESLHTDMEMM
ncbi:TIGR04255 family protein [Kosakonia cowanii]